MDVKIVQFVTVHHLPKLLYPMPPKFVKSSSALIQKVRNSLLLHFQIALERHNAHRNRPTESFAFYFCNILHVQFFKSITILGYQFDNVLFLEWNITVNMDEDHNQEAGFVTEEVNQVVKVNITRV